MREAAHFHRSRHRLPADCLGQVRDNCFERDTFERVWICVLGCGRHLMGAEIVLELYLVGDQYAWVGTKRMNLAKLKQTLTMMLLCPGKQCHDGARPPRKTPC